MSIKIDDIPISEYNLRCELDHEHPALPSTRDYTVSIPGMAGAYDYGADMGVRDFELPMVLKNVDSNNAVAEGLRNFTKALMNPDGTPKTVKLSFDYEPEKFYMVRYSGSLPLQRLVYIGRFNLPLTAFDPSAYALSSAYDSEIDYLYDEGYKYDSGIYYDNSNSFSWVNIIHYTGTHNYSFYDSDLKIFIKGSCKNPKITHLESGTVLSITGDFTSADEIIIDTKEFLIIQNKEINLLSKYNGDFFQLVEGDNGFKFESETSPNAVVTLEWNHRFM